MCSGFMCRECNRLLTRPVQTRNGHRFCEKCFFARRHTTRCKLCLEDSVPEDLDCFKLGKSRGTYEQAERVLLCREGVDMVVHHVEFVYGDRAVVYDMYKLPACCKECNYESNYLDIMKNHIKTSCRDGGCCQGYRIDRLLNKLTNMYMNVSNCRPPC